MKTDEVLAERGKRYGNYRKHLRSIIYETRP